MLKLKEPKKISRSSNEVYFFTVHKNLIFLGDIRNKYINFFLYNKIIIY